jgi:hypothetical protein
MNSTRLRHLLSAVYASDTRAGSRVFQASSASRTFCAAVSGVNGGNGGRSFVSTVNPKLGGNGPDAAAALPVTR